MANVIFLDIDGVVLPFGAYGHLHTDQVLRNPDEYMDELVKLTPVKLIDNIKALANDLDADIVLISTWRYLFPQEWLKKYLSKVFSQDFPDMFSHYFHDDWIAMEGDRVRWMHFNSKNVDMFNWLWSHEFTGNAYIIDDENDPNTHPELNVEWIKTDPHKGYVHSDYTSIRDGHTRSSEAEQQESGVAGETDQ